MRRHYRIIVIAIVVSVLALTLHHEAAATSIHGLVKSVDTPSYALNRTTYVPLILACESHGLLWEWDPIGKVAVVKKNGIEVRLRADSYRMYVGGKIENLEKPPLLYNGSFVIPHSFAEKTLPEIFKEETQYIPGVTPAPRASETLPRHAIRKVVIDPGHGGKDPGAIGAYGLHEKVVVLDIAKQLKQELEKAGLDVVLTRDADVFVPLWKRAAIANNGDADFFISLHANAFRSQRVKGFEVYYLSEATDDNARALEAAENASLEYEDICFLNHTKDLDAVLWDLTLTENRRQARELASQVCNTVSESLAVTNRGVKTARFYVLKGARMPAVLIEVGFISNSRDAESLSSAYYRKKLAQAIADSILRYRTEYETSDGFTR